MVSKTDCLEKYCDTETAEASQETEIGALSHTHLSGAPNLRDLDTDVSQRHGCLSGLPWYAQ